MENHNTVDSILEALGRMAERKEPIDPHTWLQGCSKLVALMGGEQELLYELESTVAKKKVEFMNSGDNGTVAKAKAEAMDEYMFARKMKAKIERCYEIIRVSKLMARLAFDEFKSGQ